MEATGGDYIGAPFRGRSRASWIPEATEIPDFPVGVVPGPKGGMALLPQPRFQRLAPGLLVSHEMPDTRIRQRPVQLLTGTLGPMRGPRRRIQVPAQGQPMVAAGEELIESILVRKVLGIRCHATKIIERQWPGIGGGG